MIERFAKRAPGASQGGPGKRRNTLLPLAVTAVLALTGCGESGTTELDNFRFGQVGEIRIQVVTPLAGRSGLMGELQQSLTWNSEGPWQLFESISYRGILGDAQLRSGTVDPGGYAELIIQLNDTPGLQLFVDELDPGLDPVCEGGDGRISFAVRDNLRNEESRWTRCTSEVLEKLSEASAGPDAAAARLVTASRRARDQTLGPGATYTYSGSVPFGTLDRGEVSQVSLELPIVFLGQPGPGGDTLPPSGWEQFWKDHTGSEDPPPEVAWSEDMVVVAAVGVRQEAGDSVEVHRILQVGSGTIVELHERVPGDFCSPAFQIHTPFHIVVAPLTPPGYRFSEIKVERVPCGA
jgi:hypothetical protein